MAREAHQEFVFDAQLTMDVVATGFTRTVEESLGGGVRPVLGKIGDGVDDFGGQIQRLG